MPRYGVRGRRASRIWLVPSVALSVAVAAALMYLANGEIGSVVPAASAKRPNEVYRLLWNGPITPAAAGALVAQVDGLFARARITISLHQVGDDASIASAVAADDNTIGYMTATGFLRARAAGIPIIAIAAGYTTNSAELYSLSITPLQSPADLAGKTLGYIVDSDVGVTVEALIRKQIARSQIKVIDARLSITDLLRGRVDVLAGRSEVEGEELRALKFPFRTLNPAAFGVRSVGTVYVASERALARQPDLAERFLAALIQGWDAAYTDYARTIPIIERAIDRDTAPAGIAGFMDRQRPFIRPYGARMGELDLARWRDLQDRLLEQRIISQRVDLKRAVMFSLVPELYRTRLKALATN